MGTSDPNWDRWILSSVIQDFDTWNKALPTPYDKFVEGEERKTNKSKSWVELRFDGVSKFQYSKDFWKLELDVNFVCSVGAGLDLFAPERMKGDISSWFKPAICVYKFGSGSQDDGTFLGTLQQASIGRDNVLVRDYGQVDPKTQLRQATLTAHYFMDIP